KARPAVALRHDVEVLHLQQVAGLCALDVHRPGERVRDRALQALEILRRGARADLQVVGIARLERELLARLDLDNRREVWMPAVMAGVRLFREALGAIDGDGFHVNAYPPSVHRPYTGYPQQPNSVL